MKKAIIHCRVSTNKQAQQGESLDTQEKICRSIAKRKNAEVVKVWREHFSGRSKERPSFDEMLNYVKQNKGKIDYLIFRDIDRLTRNGSYYYQQIKMKFESYGVELVDSLGLIQPSVNTLEHLGFEYSWSKYNPSGITENMKAEIGQEEVRSILTRMIGTEIQLVQKGFHIGMSNDGYINKKIYVEGKKRTIQIPDPNRAHYFIEMFKMRASGLYSDQEIVDKINAMGYKSREQNKWDQSNEKIIGKKGGRKLEVKHFQRLIQYPIYCGVICRDWTYKKPVRAYYPGLIDIQTFNKANNGKVYIQENTNNTLEIFYDYKQEKIIKPKDKDNPLYPFKRIILCPYCHKPFVGSAPKGKSKKGFPTYHCSKGHQYFGVNKTNFETPVIEYLSKLRFTDQFLKTFKLTLEHVWESKKLETEQLADKTKENTVALLAQKERIIEAIVSTTNESLKKELETKFEALETEIEKSQTTKKELEIKKDDIDSFFACAKKLMEHPIDLLINRLNINKTQALLELVFARLPDYFQITNGTPELSLIFQLSESFKRGKSLSVTRAGFEPATISLKGCCSTS